MDKYEDFRNDMMDIDAKKMAEEAVELESLKAKLDDCSGRVETIQRGDGRRWRVTNSKSCLVSDSYWKKANQLLIEVNRMPNISCYFSMYQASIEWKWDGATLIPWEYLAIVLAD